MKRSNRALRVSVSGTRARVDNVDANVLNVSKTGALVRTSLTLRRGANVPVVLDLPLGSVQVTARVVRAETVGGPVFVDNALRNHFAIALAFVTPSDEAKAILNHVCAHHRRHTGMKIGPLHLGGARYCPRCYSRSVVRGRNRRYTCDDCSRRFFGFRIGFVRVAF